MKQSILACVVSGVAIVCSTPATAQTILPNGQFSSLDGWSAPFGQGSTFTLDGTSGSPDTPSGLLTIGGTPNAYVVSDCIPYSPTGPVDLQGDVKNTAQGLPEFHGLVQLVAYTDEACGSSGQYFPTTTCFPLSAGWQRCSNLGLVLPPDTRSLRIDLSVSFLSVSANFDNIRLGPTGTVPVTLQSFDIE